MNVPAKRQQKVCKKVSKKSEILNCWLFAACLENCWLFGKWLLFAEFLLTVIWKVSRLSVNKYMIIPNKSFQWREPVLLACEFDACRLFFQSAIFTGPFRIPQWRACRVRYLIIPSICKEFIAFYFWSLLWCRRGGAGWCCQHQMSDNKGRTQLLSIHIHIGIQERHQLNSAA